METLNPFDLVLFIEETFRKNIGKCLIGNNFWLGIFFTITSLKNNKGEISHMPIEIFSKVFLKYLLVDFREDEVEYSGLLQTSKMER